MPRQFPVDTVDLAVAASNDYLLIADTSSSSEGKRIRVQDLRNAINVLDYGADRTGQTNSSAAFANAAAAANAASGGRGGAVAVPAGEYQVEAAPLDTGSSIDGTLLAPITWLGDGPSSTRIVPPPGASSPLFACSGLSQDLIGGGVQGFTLLGDATNDISYDGTLDCIDVSAAARTFYFRVQDCRISRFRSGYKGTDNDRSPMFLNTEFRYNINGIEAGGNHPVFGSGTAIRYNDYGILVPDGKSIFDAHLIGVKLSYNNYGISPANAGAGTGVVRNIFYTGGSIFGNRYVGIDLNGSTNASHHSRIAFAQIARQTGGESDTAIRVRGDDIAIEDCTIVTFGASNEGFNNGVIEVVGDVDRLSVCRNAMRRMDCPLVVINGGHDMRNSKFNENIIDQFTPMDDGTRVGGSGTNYQTLGGKLVRKTAVGGAWYFNQFNSNILAAIDSGTDEVAVYNAATGSTAYNSVQMNQMNCGNSPAATSAYFWDANLTNQSFLGNVTRRGAGLFNPVRGGSPSQDVANTFA